MPTVLTSSQQTFVDITDQRKLSAYITSNLPKTQSEDPNVLPHTYAPSWASTHLVLTPVVFLDQTSIPHFLLDRDNALCDRPPEYTGVAGEQITWKVEPTTGTLTFTGCGRY